MPAPLKKTSAQTGRWGGLLSMVVVLLAICGVLAYSATLPSTSKKIDPVLVSTEQTTVPQVAGDQTEAEYVAPEDVTAAPAEPTQDAQKVLYKVASVSDGDTIKVAINGKTETIRLIGVDTPETKDPRKPVQCYGHEASDFTKNTLSGKSVRLEIDRTQQNRDKYGRLLRYVFLNDDANFNLLLISEGYAHEYTYNVPYQYQKQFKDAQEQASAAKIGLWSASTCNGITK